MFVVSMNVNVKIHSTDKHAALFQINFFFSTTGVEIGSSEWTDDRSSRDEDSDETHRVHHNPPALKLQEGS